MLLNCSQTLAIPGVRWWGELGYNYRMERNEGSADLEEHIPVLRLNASGYLYRPWVGTLEGGLQLQANRASLDSGRTESDNVSGDLRLRLFPLSRFPLELFAERVNTDVDSELSGFSLDRTRYGILQRYNTEAGTGFRFRYEHTDLTNLSEQNTIDVEERTDVADFFEAAVQRTLNHHNLSFNTDLSRVDTLDHPRETTTSFSALRHSYRPGPDLSAEDMLTYSRTSREEELFKLDTNILQLTSYAFWRPAFDRPLRLNATLRAVSRENDSDSAMSSTANSASTSLFANYELNESWLLTGGVGGTGTDIEDDRSTTSFQTVRATYNSTTAALLGFEANLFGRVNVSNDTEDNDSVQNYGAQIGYRVGRGWRMGDGSARAELRQSISQDQDTDEFSATRLLTDISLQWSLQDRNRSTIARVSLSDSRTEPQGLDVRNVDGDFQIANAQLSVNHRFSSDTSIIGNITLQAIREYRPELRFVDLSNNGDWRPTATADLTYFTRSLFGVRRLSFRSTLRFISDSIMPLLMEPDTIDGRDNKYWENRLEYTVGRIHFRLIGRLNDINSTRRVLTLLQIRRMIGDA